MQVRFRVNGAERCLEVEPRRLLADVLRHELGLFGVHLGCEHGVCGACTVLLNGETVRSCLMLAVQAEGCDITTIEGLGRPGGLHPVQEAFRKAHGLQCGFCTPAMVLAVKELLEEVPDPDEATIRERLAGNICRCTGYVHIVQAVRLAAQMMRTRPGVRS